MSPEKFDTIVESDISIATIQGELFAINSDSRWWTTTSSAPRTLSTLYNCKYCGTEYIADMTGFIPNCHNCGAKMERVNEY